MNSAQALNTLEFLGALSARLAHALSNHLSIVSGNLCVATALQDDPEKASAALHSAMKGANEAGMLISRFVDLRRSIGIGSGATRVSVALGSIGDWCSKRAGWNCRAPDDMGPVAGLDIAMPADWLRYFLDAMAEETKASGGTIAISFRPGKAPAAFMLDLAFDLSEAKVIDWNAVRRDLANFRLTASYELIGQAGGKIEASVDSAGAQRTRVLLPVR